MASRAILHLQDCYLDSLSIYDKNIEPQTNGYKSFVQWILVSFSLLHDIVNDDYCPHSDPTRRVIFKTVSKPSIQYSRVVQGAYLEVEYIRNVLSVSGTLKYADSGTA